MTRQQLQHERRILARIRKSDSARAWDYDEWATCIRLELRGEIVRVGECPVVWVLAKGA